VCSVEYHSHHNAGYGPFAGGIAKDAAKPACSIDRYLGDARSGFLSSSGAPDAIRFGCGLHHLAKIQIDWAEEVRVDGRVGVSAKASRRIGRVGCRDE